MVSTPLNASVPYELTRGHQARHYPLRQRWQTLLS